MIKIKITITITRETGRNLIRDFMQYPMLPQQSDA